VPEVRLSSKLSVGLLAAASALVAPAAAQAFSPYLVVPDPAVAEASPAYRYANMTDVEALAELDRRGVLYSKIDAVPGVRAPIRLAGRLHGVYVHASLPKEKRAVSPFEILDARLALALDDFCALLERHDIDEVVHFTMYRPNVAAPQGVARGPAEKRGKATTRRARTSPKTPALAGLHQTTGVPPGTRHPAGLAIDVGLLHLRDGRWLSVQHDFHGHVGEKTCGEGAPSPESPDARELRALVCESSNLGLFTYVLTPDYNAAHADHFHMEIKPGVRWFLYH
jgi:hypothetical protein